MILRLKQRLKKIFNWYQLLAFALFFIVILIMADVVGFLDRGIQVDTLQTIVLLAAVFNMLTAAVKRLKPFFLAMGRSILGIIVSFWIVGDLTQPGYDFLSSAADYLKSSWLYLIDQVEILPDSSIWIENWRNLTQAVSVLVDRLGLWIGGLPDPSYDPVTLNLIWGTAVWLAATWLYLFLVVHKKALLGVLPILAICGGVFWKTDAGMYSLFWVLGFGLLLELLSHQSRQEDFWRLAQLSFSIAIRKKTTENALALSLALVFFAGLISSPKLDEFIDDLKSPGETRSSGAQGSDTLNDEEAASSGSFASDVLDEVSFGRFPNSHLVDSGPELSEKTVMYVSVDDHDAQEGDRQYLRSSSYATYTIHGWLTADRGFILHEPQSVSEVEYGENEKLVFQEVILLDGKVNGNLMYSVGELVSGDVYYYTSYHTKFVDDTYTDIFAAVTPANQYSAYSIVPNFGVEELRNSTQEYPAWITSKYLQIPNDVPDRVYQLALRLTATEPTPYDRALAIEQYLRQFEYTLDLESPPAYHDIADYFLFELQKGYCDYFATSMVVMARAAGLPSRFVTGYVAGTFNAEVNRYTVTADQAHAWVEVYFPGYGWVTFEPTPGRPEPERFEDREVLTELADSEMDFDQPGDLGGETLFSSLPENIFVLVMQVVFTAIVGIAAAHWIDLSLLKAMEPNKMYSRLYRRLRKRAKSLGVKIRQADTPLEFSEQIEVYLQKVGPIASFEKVFQSAADNAKLIISACSLAAYGKDAATKGETLQAVSSWGRLRWQMFIVDRYLSLVPLGSTLRRIWRRMREEMVSGQHPQRG